MNIDYAVNWVRQEENQCLSCSRDVAPTLPTELLRLMGYDAPNGHGRVYDWNDPCAILNDKREPVSEAASQRLEHRMIGDGVRTAPQTERA